MVRPSMVRMVVKPAGAVEAGGAPIDTAAGAAGPRCNDCAAAAAGGPPAIITPPCGGCPTLPWALLPCCCPLGDEEVDPLLPPVTPLVVLVVVPPPPPPPPPLVGAAGKKEEGRVEGGAAGCCCCCCSLPGFRPNVDSCRRTPVTCRVEKGEVAPDATPPAWACCGGTGGRACRLAGGCWLPLPPRAVAASPLALCEGWGWGGGWDACCPAHRAEPLLPPPGARRPLPVEEVADAGGAAAAAGGA